MSVRVLVEISIATQDDYPSDSRQLDQKEYPRFGYSFAIHQSDNDR